MQVHYNFAFCSGKICAFIIFTNTIFPGYSYFRRPQRTLHGFIFQRIIAHPSSLIDRSTSSPVSLYLPNITHSAPNRSSFASSSGMSAIRFSRSSLLSCCRSCMYSNVIIYSSFLCVVGERGSKEFATLFESIRNHSPDTFQLAVVVKIIFALIVRFLESVQRKHISIPLRINAAYPF